MKKILYISEGYMVPGGIEKLELDYAKYLNDNFKIEFLTPNNLPFKNYEDEIEKMHCNWYNLNTSRKNFFNKIIYDIRLFRLLMKHKYDIIHINAAVFLYSFRVVVICKLCGVKKIVVHSHGCIKSKGIRKLLFKILNPIYVKLTNVHLSCSKEASKSLFSKKVINENKVILLKNGIEVDKYKFNEDIRNEYRKNLNLEEKTVYGHIGIFRPEKNHEFLIDIFNEIQKINPNSVLLLIGNGALKEKIYDKVQKLNINEKVIFLDFREDANNILNCMDAFIFPSLNEGLGISVIEAQTNGLKTFCSNMVPPEANISPYYREFNLNDDVHEIAKRICEEKLDTKTRNEAYKFSIENGFEIKDTCNILENIYNSL